MVGLHGESPFLRRVESEGQGSVRRSRERRPHGDCAGEPGIHRLHGSEPGEGIKGARGVADGYPHRPAGGGGGPQAERGHVGRPDRRQRIARDEPGEIHTIERLPKALFGVPGGGFRVEHHRDVAPAADYGRAPDPAVTERLDQRSLRFSGGEMRRQRGRPEGGPLPVSPGQDAAAAGGVHERPGGDLPVVLALPPDHERGACVFRVSCCRSLDDLSTGRARLGQRPVVQTVAANEVLTLPAAGFGLGGDPVRPSSPADEVIGRSRFVGGFRQFETVGGEQARRGGGKAFPEMLPVPPRPVDEDDMQAEGGKLSRGQRPGRAAADHRHVGDHSGDLPRSR